jgi:AAA15 family ATPase/GTPase
MLDGFSIHGYRSFGQEGIHISDLSKVNAFIGKNNSGKSNILRFIALLADLTKKRGYNERPPALNPLLDFCLNDTKRQLGFGVQVKRGGFTDEIFNSIREPFGNAWDDVFPDNKTSMWFYYNASSKKEALESSVDGLAQLIARKCRPDFTNQLTSQLCSYTGGSEDKRNRDIAQALHSRVNLGFTVSTIEAFRKITDGGGHVLSGSGLIKELRKLQSPELAQYDAGKKRFKRINDFLASLLGIEGAHLEIPAEQDEILVTLDNKVLPLGSLGTGIHELIIMAAAVTLVDNSIFCIEEPEIHLHPDLQKKFIRYIASETSNQYLIATHSNALFDLPDLCLYRCWQEFGASRCEMISTAQDKFHVLQDLGYRPSDLLQANYLIWVEGPSDRILINWWITAKAPDLVEGVHYAIMFYGGRLLAHLAFDDPSVNDFIKLSRLNRSACIVIDSDKRSPSGKLNATKRRVITDFRKSKRLVWVTMGRTIENYIDGASFSKAVLDVHPKAGKCPKWERYADMTRLSAAAMIDKVAVARSVATASPDFAVLDLDSMLNKLVRDIRLHNG